MDTIENRASPTYLVAGAAVTGARHRRIGRNGQDAVATWADDDAAAIAVCDGCGAGASSEVGARLGAALWIGALAARLRAGDPVTSPATWAAVRAELATKLAALVEAMPGDRAVALHDHFLFTIVSAAVGRDGLAIWALGDGAYSIDGATRVLGPFADNQPPYLGYDLIGSPQPPHFTSMDRSAGLRSIIIATDGALDLRPSLDDLVAGRLAHPDALRRRLTVLARGDERIDWDNRAVVRAPAPLQDDCAIAAIAWRQP